MATRIDVGKLDAFIDVIRAYGELTSIFYDSKKAGQTVTVFVEIANPQDAGLASGNGNGHSYGQLTSLVGS